MRRATIQLLATIDGLGGGIPDEVDDDSVERASRLLAAWTRDLLGTESVPMRLLFGS